MTDTLAMLTQAEHMLAEVRTVQDAEDIKRAAEAARVLAAQMRLGTSAINHATAIKLKAEIRLAAVVDDGQSSGEIADLGWNQHEGVRGADTLPDLGVDRQRLAEARVLARGVDDSIIDQTIDAANEVDAVVSRSAVLSAARDVALGKLHADGIPASVTRRVSPTQDVAQARLERAERAIDVLASLPTDLVESVAATISPSVTSAALSTIRAVIRAQKGA